MPKLIDYPRTTYATAWELSEVVDDTGGKCAIDTAARKLNRKVSGSFKAIIGSAVKFGLLTSKRELLSTTTLFRRIKHAYDKQEELLFHREAFLNPPLFTQLCRKFRSRELPVQMLDVMLIREFDVEEINAQAVAKVFTDGARMVGLLDEQNVVADLDQLAAQAPPRRELASPPPAANTFRPTGANANASAPRREAAPAERGTFPPMPPPASPQHPEIAATASDRPLRPQLPPATPQAGNADDAIAQLFGLGTPPPPATETALARSAATAVPQATPAANAPNSANGSAPARTVPGTPTTRAAEPLPNTAGTGPGYQLQLNGPGVNTTLTIHDLDDLELAQAMLEKIRRQLNAQ